MLLRVLLYLCAVVSGLAWFSRWAREPQQAFSGEGAVIFLTLTVALGSASIADAIEQLRAAPEEKRKPPGPASEGDDD